MRARMPDELGSGVVHGGKQGGRGQDELDESRRNLSPDTNLAVGSSMEGSREAGGRTSWTSRAVYCIFKCYNSFTAIRYFSVLHVDF